MTKPIHRLEDTYSLSRWAEPSVSILRKDMACDVAHDEGHITRVVRNALTFCPDGDKDIIIPAAVLHDLVNAPKTDKVLRPKASQLSADRAIQCLKEILPFKGIFHEALVRNAIEAHSYSANIATVSPEAEAVQDADRIEALGFIGASRCMAVTGVMNRALFDPIDPAALNRPLDEYAYGIDHFKTKLFTLAKTMKTEKGMRKAIELTAKMRYFYDSLIEEVQGE